MKKEDEIALEKMFWTVVAVGIGIFAVIGFLGVVFTLWEVIR